MNDDDLKKIQDYARKEKENKKQKYGFDTYEKYDYLKKRYNKQAVKKRRKIRFIVIIILIIVFVVGININFRQFKEKRYRMFILKSAHELDFEEQKVYTDITGYGFLVYNVEKIPNLEIHAICTKDHPIIEDFDSRIYKYFFDKWDDPDKSKFIVKESYKDYTYKSHTEKNWFLNFKTYIEVSSYEEMLEATELIIKFRDYMKYTRFIMRSYIKYDDKLILPNLSSLQTDDEMRNATKEQFLKIERGESDGYIELEN